MSNISYELNEQNMEVFKREAEIPRYEFGEQSLVQTYMGLMHNAQDEIEVVQTLVT